MPAHHALEVPEIVELIVQQSAFYETSSGEIRDDPGTLASLARACKMFAGPSLDMLWAEQHSLDPLLNTLPCLSERPRNANRVLACSNEEFSRFQMYALRIRKLTGAVSPGLAYGFPGVLEHLHARNSRSCRTPLCPRLNSLCWEQGDDFQAITTLLCEGLEHLTMHLLANPDKTPVRSGDETLAWLLERIGHSAPGLRSLTLMGCARAVPLLDLAPCTALRRIYFGTGIWCFEMQTIWDLPRFPQLRQLHIAIGTMLKDSEADVQMFKDLRKLEVHGRAQYLIVFLSTLLCPVLESLNMSLEGDGRGLYHALHATVAAQFLGLKEFTVEAFHADQSEALNFPDVYSPLRQLPSLQNVVLALLTTVPSDGELIGLFSAWPHIRRIEVRSTSWALYEGGGELPTLMLLAKLAHCCPALERLSLPALDFSSVWNPTWSDGVSSHPLRFLTVERWFGAIDSQAILEFLRVLFPVLPGVRVFPTTRRLIG